MSHPRILKTVTISLTLSLLPTISARALAQSASSSSNYYPDAAVAHIYTEHEIEQKRAEELEEKLAQQRDLLERKKREAERQIAAHRFEIEGLKMRQEKAQDELDSIAVELQQANGNLSSYQAEHQQLTESTDATLKYLNDQRAELADKQKQSDDELQSLTDARKKSEKDIFGLSMDIEHYKSDVTKTETKIQEAESQRTALEAEEMQVRSDWMNAKMQAADHVKQRNEALNQLAEAKKRFQAAEKDLQSARADLAKAEKMRNETEHKTHTDVAKYESDILQANKNRIASEAEEIRLQSENDKLREYASRLKDARDEAVENQINSEGLVLKSTLALENTRTGVTSSIEGSQQAAYKSESQKNQARGLAAAEQAAQMVNGNPWVTTKKCTAYSQPRRSSIGKNAAGFFESGKHLLARDHGAHWTEILDTQGASVFVENNCGHYEN